MARDANVAELRLAHGSLADEVLELQEALTELARKHAA